MKTISSLWILAVFIVVAFGDLKPEGAWKSNYEYRYEVKSKTLSALPNLKNEWVGLTTKADLVVRKQSEDVLIGKFENAKYAEVNGEHADDLEQEIPNEDLDYKSMRMNSEPFEIRLSNGTIHSIAVDNSMTNTELNHLKGVLSQLQVDLRARNQIKSKLNQLPENEMENTEDSQPLYKVMEPTVTGKCETTYDIVKLPNYLARKYTEHKSTDSSGENSKLYEITKTKDYSKCDQKMGYHFGLSGSNDQKDGPTSMESLSKSGLSRIIITGNYKDYTIRSSSTTNRIVKVNPDGSDNDSNESRRNAMVVSHIKLNLVSMEKSESGEQLQSYDLVDVGNLVYAYDKSSSRKNEVKAKKDSSEESKSEPLEDDSKDGEYSESNSEEEKKYRSPRSLNEQRRERNYIEKDIRIRTNTEKQRKSSSSSESDSTEDDDSKPNSADDSREYYQPKPALDEAPEDPLQELFIGDDGKSVKNTVDVKEETMKLAKEISEDLESANDLPKKHTLWKYNMLTNLIRTMDSKQLNETSKAILKDGKDNKYWKTYRDAVANAGTGPAVDEVMKWIENNYVKGEEAAQLIANMPKSIRTPTEEMQRRFFNFVKEDVVRKDTNLNVTAGFALTRFLYKSQVNNKSASSYYPVEMYGRLADRNSDFVGSEVVPYFAEELKRAVKDNDRVNILYAIRALGNLGHAKVPKAFEPYLEGEIKVSKFQRLAMVIALDKYIVNYPKAAKLLLFKLYQNRGDISEVRSAAVFQLMRTQPSAEILQRMAQQANGDENKDVRSAVRSALKSAAESKNSKNEQLAKDAKSALNLIKTDDEGLYYSQTHLVDYVKKHFGVSYDNQLNYIVGRDSFIPNIFQLITEKNLNGLKRHSEQQAMISSVERLTNLLSSPFEESDEDTEQNYSDEREESKEESKWSVKKIFEMLKMKSKTGEKLEGQVLLSAMGSKRMFAFDEDTMKRAPEYVSKMLEHLKSGKKINYSKFYYEDDVTIAFPLETGLPFVYQYRTPSLMHVDGKVQVSTTSNVVDETKNKIRLPETTNMNMEVRVVYSTTTLNKVGFIDPRTAQMYSAGILTKAQVNLPLRTETTIDMRESKVKTELKPLNTDKTTNLVHLSSMPFTARKNIRELRPTAESKYSRTIHVRPVTTFNYTFGENLLGSALTIEGKTETKLNNLSDQLKKLYTSDPMSLIMLRQRSLTPEYYSFEMKYSPERLPTSSKGTTKITVNYVTKSKDKSDPEDDRKSHPRDINNKDDLSMPDSTKPDSEERRDQLLRDAARGLKSPKTAVFDVGIEFDYHKNVNYTLTASSSSSKIEEKSRHLLFVSRRSSGQSEPKAIYMQVDVDNKNNPMRDDTKDDVSTKADMKMIYGNPEKKDKTMARGTVELGQKSTIEKTNGIKYMKTELYLENPSPLERSYIHTIYDYLNSVTHSHIKEERTNTDENEKNNKLAFETELAKDMKSVSVKMSTSEKETEWETVRVPKLVRRVLRVPKSEQLKELKYETSENECLFTKNIMKTFGDQTVNYDLGETWHLAVQKSWPIRKNADDKNDDKTKTTEKTEYDGRVSILVRDATQKESDKNENSQTDEETKKGKEVLIVLHKKEGDEMIKLLPKKSSESSPRLYVDEMEKTLDPDEETVIYTKTVKKPWAKVYITRYGDLNLRLKNESLDLLYNGDDVKVKSDSMFRDNRGLCGAYTGDSILDRKAPNDLIINDDDEYTASWALTDNKSPKKLSELKQRITEENYSPEEVSYGNAVPNKEKPENKNKSNAGKHKCQTKHQTQYVEKGTQVCFSKRKLPVCSPNECKPNGKTIQNVDVHCRDVKDAAAEQYKRQIDSGRSLDMTSHTTTKKINFSIPKRCVSTRG